MSEPSPSLLVGAGSVEAGGVLVSPVVDGVVGGVGGVTGLVGGVGGDTGGVTGGFGVTGVTVVGLTGGGVTPVGGGVTGAGVEGVTDAGVTGGTTVVSLAVVVGLVFALSVSPQPSTKPTTNGDIAVR